MNLKKAIQFAKSQASHFESTYFELLKIPSISTHSSATNDINQAAEFIKRELVNAGLEVDFHHPQNGHPIITAQKIVNPNLPTLLIYGHYDVQPADPIDDWTHPPFSPTVINQRVYARGASDDKGQFLIHLNAVKSILANYPENQLPVNIKFLVEGEEEISSPSLFPFLSQHAEKLSCDYIVISDTEMFSLDYPSLTYGLRGICYFDVILTGPNRDLHSGMYGGIVENPANVLAEILASLYQNDEIQIDGFYDDVLPFDKEEIKRLNALPCDLENYKKALGVHSLKTHQGKINFYKQNSAIPTFDINGLSSGYQEEGAKTIIPSVAKAKISFRLVPNQKAEKIVELVKKQLTKIVPPTMNLTIKEYGSGDPFIINPESHAFLAARKALKEVYQVEPHLMRSGGSIPIVSEFKNQLKAEVVLMGFGLPEDKIHSPNESFSLIDFHRGIESSIRFIDYLSS